MGGTSQPRVVVITGASAGVGRATAREFARRGARIGLLARGRAGLAGAAGDVSGLGGVALPLSVDVADADAVDQAAERIERELGPIDVWVNNATVTVFAPVAEVTAEEFRRVTEVTYLGYVYGTLAALRRMRSRNRGAIVQVGSALAYRGIPLQSAYCAAKHAIQGFNDSLRAELIHDGSAVRVTMVQLPALNTPQFEWTRSRMERAAQPVPPIYQPEVAAEAIVHAADHDRREWHVGAMTTAVIVGNKLLPGLGDAYLAHTGYESQLRDRPRDPAAPDNLFEAADEDVDFGAHGAFDDRAHRFCPLTWFSRNRAGVALAGLAGLAGLAALALRGRSPSNAPVTPAFANGRR
ncbi:MAG: SDR family oxidoreductase [Planctomyces sp.]|nr:SDR family oxidoreductase [Planctomyces sp.]